MSSCEEEDDPMDDSNWRRRSSSAGFGGICPVFVRSVLFDDGAAAAVSAIAISAGGEKHQDAGRRTGRRAFLARALISLNDGSEHDLSYVAPGF